MVGSAECGVGSAECVESSPVRQLRTPHSALRIGSMSLLDRVRALLGSDALLESAGPDGVPRVAPDSPDAVALLLDRKSTRLNSSHDQISYAVFCLKKKRRLMVLRLDLRRRGAKVAHGID